MSKMEAGCGEDKMTMNGGGGRGDMVMMRKAFDDLIALALCVTAHRVV